jgi:hypothetical protein
MTNQRENPNHPNATSEPWTPERGPPARTIEEILLAIQIVNELSETRTTARYGKELARYMKENPNDQNILLATEICNLAKRLTSVRLLAVNAIGYSASHALEATAEIEKRFTY